MKRDDRHAGRPPDEPSSLPHIIPLLRDVLGRVVTIREANADGARDYVEAIGEGLETDIAVELGRLTERRAA